MDPGVNKGQIMMKFVSPTVLKLGAAMYNAGYLDTHFDVLGGIAHCIIGRPLPWNDTSQAMFLVRL